MCVALTVLFNAPSMRQTYTRRNEFWLLDSFGYYMENLPRFCDPNFTPTEEDVVMARIRTTGIVATPLEQKIAKELPEEPDSLRFNVIDVGGQRNERKKWLHCFDDVKCVLFLVNLAGFNQVLFEDNSKNRMHESLELFKTIVNKDLFRKIPIFLFLNKKDLFEQQILQTDMKQTFPSYQGGKNNSNALQYITEMFQAEMPKKKALVQVVTGTWKRDIKCAFEAVKSTLYDMNRRKLLQKASDIRARMAELERAHAKANAGCCGPAPAKQPINKK
jgi:GTPase SAR1 family protein